MNWIALQNKQEVDDIKQLSFSKPQVIFKHSTRCSISTMAKSRLERSSTPTNLDFHYLDLIAYRDISALVANEFDVQHESPQIIVLKDGKCIYDESHSGINMDEIVAASN